MDLISKKELLAVTGISYGQLYRWKRQGLSPEEWFIKRSAYTGQETFFPREQILSRIRTIQGAKDDYSLEELSRLLRPQADPGFCPAERLPEVSEISPALLPTIARLCHKATYEFYEVVVFAAVSQILAGKAVPQDRAGDLLAMVLGAAEGFSDLSDATLTLFTEGEGRPIHLLLSKTAAPLALDRGLETLGSWDLGSIAGTINLKYQKGRN